MVPWRHADEWRDSWLPWLVTNTAKVAVENGIDASGFDLFRSEDPCAQEFIAAIREVARNLWQGRAPECSKWKMPTKFEFGVRNFARPVRLEMLQLRKSGDGDAPRAPARAPRPPPFQNNLDEFGIGAYLYEDVFTVRELADWVGDEGELEFERFGGDDSGRAQAHLSDAFADEKVQMLVERNVLMQGYIAGRGRGVALLKNMKKSMPEQRLHTDYLQEHHLEKCAGVIVALDPGVYVALAGRLRTHAQQATVLQRRHVRPGSVLVLEPDAIHAGMGGTGFVGHRRVHFYIGRDMAAKDIPPRRNAQSLNTYFLVETSLDEAAPRKRRR